MWEHLFMLMLGVVVCFVLFPRNKTTNVRGDYIESQKNKDRSKAKNRRGLFFWIKKDRIKQITRKSRRLRKSLQTKED